MSTTAAAMSTTTWRPANQYTLVVLELKTGGWVEMHRVMTLRLADGRLVTLDA